MTAQKTYYSKHIQWEKYEAMNPPTTIRILHLDFDFRFMDETFFDAAGAYGHCDKKRQVISVAAHLRPALMADTTLHEILHGIHFAVGCEDEMREEQIALQFAGPLCMVIRDNPQLVAWLQFLLKPTPPLVVDLGMADIDTGDIDTGDIDTGDIDTGAYQ